MKKSDLKDGMVVEYANGWRRVVLNGGELHTSGGRNCHLEERSNDLVFKLQCDLSIVKVWQSGIPKNLDSMDLGKPLWKKEKEIKLIVDGNEIVLSSETIGNIRKQFDKQD